MANEENIIPYQFTSDQDREKAAAAGRKGGKASGEAKRARKTMKEMLDYLLEKELTNSKGEIVTYREAMLTAAIVKAIKGDIKASQFVRDTVGEVPITKTEVTGKNGSPLIQKVFVSEEDKTEIDNKIDELIDGQ